MINRLSFHPFLLCFIFSALIIFVTIGCSGKKSDFATSPDISPDIADNGAIPSMIRTSEFSYQGLIGLYELKIDTNSPSAELVPIRGLGALGDTYVVDVTNFLAVAPCADCVRVKALELEPNNTLTVHIAARHPFPLPADVFNPQNNERLDLHIFDLMGIVIVDGSYIFPYTNSDFDGNGYADEPVVSSLSFVTNADGYTSILDSYYDTFRMTAARIHPYKLFAYNPIKGNYNPALDPVNGFPFLGNPVGYNVFPQGSPEYVVEYNMNIEPGSTYPMMFALSASWGQGAKGKGDDIGQRNNPRYFLPEFSRKEPYKINVNITNNTLTANTPSSSAQLTVQILDWQHGATVDPYFDFYSSNLSSISKKSDIKSVTIEIPDMGLWFDSSNLPVSTGNGSSENPFSYSFFIYNTGLAEAGTYYGLIAARDDYEMHGYNMGIERDGVTVFPIDDFTTYQVFELKVFSSDNPPIACFTTSPSPPHVQEFEQPITFDASCSSDNGAVISYEWDFDYTGRTTNFSVDSTGPIVQHTYVRPGTYLAALRVTDNNVPPQQAINYLLVAVFCTWYDTPVCSISNIPTWMTTSHNDSWETEDGKLDIGFLSYGMAVIEDNEELGYSNVSPSGNASFTPFLAGYPGKNVGSIDIDSRNRVIWVEYKGSDNVIIGSVKQRNEKMDTKVHVFDPQTNTIKAVAQLSAYGSYIQAVETDVEDNVWVIMRNNRILRLDSTLYNIVASNIYDLNMKANRNIGDVFDFSINFNNDAFYILTNSDDKGALYRFECDLSFNDSNNGFPNPLIEVFDMSGGYSWLAFFGADALADIEIDNYSGMGYNDVLTGQQDCQIVLMSCALSGATELCTGITLVNSDLQVLSKELVTDSFGTHGIGIIPDGTNMIYSIVYGNDPYLPPGCSDKELDVYSPPSGWM